MKKNIYNFVLAVLLLGLTTVTTLEAQDLAAGTAPELLGFSIERLDVLSETLDSYVNDGKLAGGVAMVARKNKIAYAKAFGSRDIESGDEMLEDDMFRIASQSKAIVSIAAMILQERGQLLISDPVEKYLPEFGDIKVLEQQTDGTIGQIDATKKVTIRHLLTHTSGFSYGRGAGEEFWEEAGIQDWYFADRDETIRESVTKMASMPLQFTPGEKYQYGYSSDILGAVVEAASGQTLDVFLKENIFDPLGMLDTHFFVPEEKVDRLATVYSSGDELTRAPDEGTMISQGHYVEGPRSNFSGGAGLVSTAGDYLRFLQMTLNGGVLFGNRILSRKSMESITADHIGDMFGGADNGQGFGLGFWVMDDLGEFGALGSEGSYGWGGAYHTTYWVDPAEELVVVYMTQLIPANNIDDHSKLRALIYQAIVD